MATWFSVFGKKIYCQFSVEHIAVMQELAACSVTADMPLPPTVL